MEGRGEETSVDALDLDNADVARGDDEWGLEVTFTGVVILATLALGVEITLGELLTCPWIPTVTDATEMLVDATFAFAVEEGVGGVG